MLAEHALGRAGGRAVCYSPLMTRLPPGKVPWEVIAPLVQGPLPPEVELGPAQGEDASILRIGDELWAVAADPVTFTAADAGRLAVVINANDVAVRGAEPRFFLATVLFPEPTATSEDVNAVLGQIRATCDRLQVALIGGHTEVAPGLDQPVISGCMLGRIVDRPVRTGGVRAGDVIGVTRSAGLEGTGILSAELGPRLETLDQRPLEGVPEGVRSGEWLSVVREALALARSGVVSALHDVTEGGVGEALHEMRSAAGVGIDLVPEAVPLLDVTRALCEEIQIDPLGLIGSGAVLVSCAPEDRSRVESVLGELEVPITWIAAAVPPGEETTPPPRFRRDELLKMDRLAGIEAVVLDMDGTVVDSTYDWAAIRAELAIDGSILDGLEELEEPDKSRRRQLLEARERSATEKATVHEGAAELLELLAAHRLQTALVTNNTAANTHELLDRFRLGFDVVVTRDDGVWKPSPDPILLALERLGVAPDAVLSVGDSSLDIAAARGAGCRCVAAVLDGAHLEADADLVFADLLALIRYLRLVLPPR